MPHRVTRRLQSFLLRGLCTSFTVSAKCSWVTLNLVADTVLTLTHPTHLPVAVGIVLAIVKQCAFRLVGNHIGLAWTHLVGVTLVYCGTMRMLNASVGTLDGCVRQSMWTSVVELASRVMFKCREVALLRVMVRVCGSWRDPHRFDAFYGPCAGHQGHDARDDATDSEAAALPSGLRRCA